MSEKLFVRYSSLVLLAFLGAVTPRNAFALRPGERPPGFVLTSSAGTETTLSEFAGKVVFLDFWASWCPTCQHSLKWLNDLQAQYGDRGLQVVTVNLDVDRKAAEKFVHQLSSDVVVAYDPEGKVPEKCEVQAMPTSVLIDPKGRVVEVLEGGGESGRTKIETEIQNLLGRRGSDVPS